MAFEHPEPDYNWIDCDLCNGTGKWYSHKCQKCNGSGDMLFDADDRDDFETG